MKQAGAVVLLLLVAALAATAFLPPLGAERAVASQAEAQGEGGAAAPGAADAQDKQPAWTFEEDEEEEAVPTLMEEARAQAIDIAAVSGFLVLAFVSFFRKSERLKIVTLVAAVAYLGFYKSQLISIVNVFGLLGGNLPLFRHNLAWYVLAIVTVVSTVLWGRVYCGRICAFGAFTQLVDRIVPARWQIKIPRALERRASMIKYGILAAALAYFLATRDPLIYPYIEPFWMFGLHLRTPVLLSMLGLLLVTTIFVRNAYCRFLCPLGAALGVLSKLTVFRIKRWSECNTCRICEKACEWGAIRGPQIVMTECVRCDDCERLYEDKTKCPHHLIIIRKSDIMARRSVAPASPGAL
jgi:NosR/NirI family transcriptional regulator, nitrous oxide reductase regulator